MVGGEDFVELPQKLLACLKIIVLHCYRLFGASCMVQQRRICLQCRKPGDVGLIPEMGWHPTPLFLTRKFHGQRSLAGDAVHGFAEKVRHD